MHQMNIGLALEKEISEKRWLSYRLGDRGGKVTRDQYEQFVRGIVWQQLSGAYGTDFQLLDRLILIASVNEQQAIEALNEVLGHSCHQDVLEEVAPIIASVLLQLLRISELPHRSAVLRSILDLIRAAWTWPRPFGFFPRTEVFNGSPLDIVQVTAITAAYDDRSQRLKGQLIESVSILINELGGNNPKDRALASRLLPLVMPIDSNRVEAALDQAWIREENEVVRSGYLISQAVIQRDLGRKSSETINRAEHGINSQDRLVRSCACTALLLLDAQNCLAQHHTVIGQALRIEQMNILDFPWGDGYPAALVAEALSIAPVPAELVAGFLIDAIDYWIGRGKGDRPDPALWTAEAITKRLMETAFRQHLGRRSYVTGNELTPIQRLLIAKLTSVLPPAFPIYAFNFCGIRNLRRDANRLLGLVKAGLDFEMEGLWEERRVRWPLWKWWHQAELVDAESTEKRSTARDYVLARVRRQLSPLQIWGAAMDSAEGGYDVPHVPFVTLVAEISEQIVTELEIYSAIMEEGVDGKKVALYVIPVLALICRKPIELRAQEAKKWPGLIQLIEHVIPVDLQKDAIQMAEGLKYK